MLKWIFKKPKTINLLSCTIFNLRALTGVNKRPNQLTLKELTNMNVTENGQTAKMVSFDDYLAKANQLKQRLLIEIKTTPQDSPDLVQRFVKQYRENILENGHILHTLTYDTAMALKKEEPRLCRLRYSFQHCGTA